MRDTASAASQAVVRETLSAISDADGMERRGLVVKLLTSLKQICNHPAQYLGEDTGAPSGKLDLLDELLDTILAEDGSVLVFTQYVAMARLLEKHLGARGISSRLLHGGTPVPRRPELVDRFQSGEVPVFLLSLKAAGTGLNLPRASHVVHYDRWWTRPWRSRPPTAPTGSGRPSPYRSTGSSPRAPSRTASHGCWSPSGPSPTPSSRAARARSPN